MSIQLNTYLKFGGATVVIFLLLGYLAYTGVQDSKSYYVTIKELHKMGDGAYSKRLRVAGNVQPGSIKRTGTHVQFVLMEEDQTLHVDYIQPEQNRNMKAGFINGNVLHAIDFLRLRNPQDRASAILADHVFRISNLLGELGNREAR